MRRHYLEGNNRFNKYVHIFEKLLSTLNIKYIL